MKVFASALSLVAAGFCVNVAPLSAAEADTIIITTSDPIGWDTWSSGSLTLTRPDQNQQAKTLTVRFQIGVPGGPALLTLSTDNWTVDLSEEFGKLSSPVTNRIKVRAVGDELVLRIPFERSEIGTTGQCMGWDVSISNGRVFDNQRFPLDERWCESYSP